MNTSQNTWSLALLLLSLCLAACTPVTEPDTASISGGVYFECSDDDQVENGNTGIADMNIRLYFGACGENLVQTHVTNEKGEFLFSGLAPGEYCVFPDFELRTCGYGGNFPTSPISRNVTLESGMKADLSWFGFRSLSGDTES